MYPPPPKKKLNYLQKKSYPPPSHRLKNLEHPDKKLKSLEYLNPMRNLKLLEKYQNKKKENLNLQENEKNITPRKSSNHPKIASTIMKKLL